MQEQIKIENHDGIRLFSPDGQLSVDIVPEAGMLLYSLQRNGQEFLYRNHSLSDYIDQGSTIGIPLLHPWANRLASQDYEVGDTKIHLDEATMPVKIIEDGRPIHGLIPSKLQWSVGEPAVTADATTLEAVCVFDQSLPQFAAFPFAHTLRYTVRLAQDSLTITLGMSVPATGIATPVAFGFHPYFQLPSGDRHDWQISLPFHTQIELHDQLPTGQLVNIQAIAGRLEDYTFDDCFLSVDQPLVLQNDTHSLSLGMDTDYRYTQIYSPEGADFICFEPMTASVDPFSQSDTPLLQPGGDFEASFVVTVR